VIAVCTIARTAVYRAGETENGAREADPRQCGKGTTRRGV
jgi:hypothetical protein